MSDTDANPDEPVEASSRANIDDEDRSAVSRRTFLRIGAAAAAGGLLMGRGCFYDVDRWSGQVLAAREAAVVAAAAAAVIPDTPGALPPAGPTAREVADNVDQFLVGMPEGMLLDIHAMFALIEHATPLGGHLARFTRLAPADGLDVLRGLDQLGSKFSQAVSGLRDLTFVGWYSDRRTWAAIGYTGPMLDRPAPEATAAKSTAGKYAELLAPADQLPERAIPEGTT